MSKWSKLILLWIFVYVPGIAIIISGFGMFGLGITIVSGILLLSNQEISFYIQAKKGFQKRLSKLPLITKKPTRNNAIFLSIYLLVLSFLSWFILGGIQSTYLRIGVPLSIAGIILFYGFFVEGWFLPNDPNQIVDDENLASLIPELDLSVIIDFIKSNVLITFALILALASPFICVGTGAIHGKNTNETLVSVSNEEVTSEQIAQTNNPTKTPFQVVRTSTSYPVEPTSTAIPKYTLTPSPERQKGLVTEIVDGDTIRVLIDGTEYSVRYIGIDTPEIQSHEWFGAEARDANLELVAGKDVLLEKDVSETDQFSRLLRYVYLLDGTFVNAELIRLGVAEAKAYPPDIKHHEEFIAIQQIAINEGLGLWRVTPTPESLSGSSNTSTVQIEPVDKRAEFVDIKNTGGQEISIDGWTLRSDKGDQDCGLKGILNPGEVLRIWALADDSDQEGYNCWFGTNIWNNSEPDAAILFDESFYEVDRYP